MLQVVASQLNRLAFANFFFFTKARKDKKLLHTISKEIKSIFNHLKTLFQTRVAI
jgi:hypothetical protein